MVIHPEPARFFELPIQEPLPEGLNYILLPAPPGAAVPILGVQTSVPNPSDLVAEAALLAAPAGPPLFRPSIDPSAPSERPTPSSFDGARPALLSPATDAKDLGLGFSKQERPGLTDDRWLDFMTTNHSSSHGVNLLHSSVDWLWAFEKLADE